VDVTPHSLGIAVAEWQFGMPVPDRYNVIIRRNTTIPTSKAQVYSALHPDQTAIELKVYQGEEQIASHNTLLGEFLFDKLKSEAPGLEPRITVTFDFDVNGILHVSAVDRGSGRTANMSVKAAHAQLDPAQKEEAHALITSLEPSSTNVTALLDPARQTLSDTDQVLERLSETVEAWGVRLMQSERTFLTRPVVAQRWYHDEYRPVVRMPDTVRRRFNGRPDGFVVQWRGKRILKHGKIMRAARERAGHGKDVNLYSVPRLALIHI